MSVLGRYFWSSMVAILATKASISPSVKLLRLPVPDKLGDFSNGDLLIVDLLIDVAFEETLP